MTYRNIILVILILTCNYIYSFSQSSASLTFSQTQNEDWTGGKYSSLETSYAHNLRYTITADKLSLTLGNRAALGVKLEKTSDTERQIIFPTDNDFFAEGMLKYCAGWIVDPYFSASFQTQITESFCVSGGVLSPTGKLWDPVTSLESWGFVLPQRNLDKRLKNQCNKGTNIF